uniref:Uncharacterized protein n=1 Tax=Rhizophora mucronata TaxID=61149 RepID=A0A2P2JZA1_RHIMU
MDKYQVVLATSLLER